MRTLILFHADTRMDFEKESEIMDMKEEMMNDTIDDVMGDEEDEAESDNIVNQVLDEIGIDMGQKMADAPIAPTPEQQAAAHADAGTARQPVAADADADLQARLDNLRRD